MGVVSQVGTAEGEPQTAMAYSINFLIYFFLGALSSSCKPCQSMPIIINLSIMADSNNYGTRPPYYYYPQQQQENSQFVPSSSYIRNQDPFTPSHSRISNIELNNTQFVPKIIESGYIVGPPIAYTQGPNLPPNFQAFSPAKSGPIEYGNSSSKVVFNQSSHLYPPQTSEIKPIQVSQPAIVVHSPIKHEESVSRILYDRSVIECKNWENRYNQLQLKYNSLVAGQNATEVQEENRRLRLRIRELQQRERSDLGASKNIRELIEKYKESTLKQCYLLLDRYRLECKQRQ